MDLKDLKIEILKQLFEHGDFMDDSELKSSLDEFYCSYNIGLAVGLLFKDGYIKSALGKWKLTTKGACYLMASESNDISDLVEIKFVGDEVFIKHQYAKGRVAFPKEQGVELIKSIIEK